MKFVICLYVGEIRELVKTMQIWLWLRTRVRVGGIKSEIFRLRDKDELSGDKMAA